MIRAILLALLLFFGAYVFVDSGDLERLTEFYNKDEVAVEEGIVDEIEEDGDSELVSDAPAELNESREVVLPGESVKTIDPQPSAILTEFGIIVFTNIERVNFGVKPLVKNSLLDKVAEAKLDDMFENQYFAHEAPNGDYVGDVADKIGYDYLLIGENLAYGDFATDKALVDAWMDSPGHRENILNGNYTEIGVAVRKGYFDGRTTWLAVQSFGAPYSLCDVIDKSLLEEINDGKEELDTLEGTLDEMRDELEEMEPKSGPEYNAKVSEYNALVAEYNALLKEVNSSVKLYNSQVEDFEECVESST